MFFHLKTSTKSKKVVDNFVKFLSKIEELPITIKHFQKKNKKSVVTVLNSPHVNKTAQEQFEFRIFKRQFLVSSSKPHLFLSLLKKIVSQSFAGMKLELKGLHNKRYYDSKATRSKIDPDNIVLNIEKKTIQAEKAFNNTTKLYVQSFDSYGEILLLTKKFL